MDYFATFCHFGKNKPGWHLGKFQEFSFKLHLLPWRQTLNSPAGASSSKPSRQKYLMALVTSKGQFWPSIEVSNPPLVSKGGLPQPRKMFQFPTLYLQPKSKVYVKKEKYPTIRWRSAGKIQNRVVGIPESSKKGMRSVVVILVQAE